MKTTSNFLKRVILGFSLFVLILILSLLVRPYFAFTIWYPIIMVFPVFPAIYIGYTLARAITVMDELQQRIQLEALAFSLANTALITFIIGLMQIEGGWYVNLTWVLPIAAAFWGLGLVMASRRYR